MSKTHEVPLNKISWIKKAVQVHVYVQLRNGDGWHKRYAYMCLKTRAMKTLDVAATAGERCRHYLAKLVDLPTSTSVVQTGTIPGLGFGASP